MSSELVVAKAAALKAAALARQLFGHVKLGYKDGVANAVTIADKKSQALIVKEIRKKFPSSGFLGEEDKLDSIGDGLNWIIDPIDGTTNFGHHIPWYAISIAAYNGLKPLVGVIVLPESRDLFFAEKGKGAYWNNKKISISTPRPLSRSYIYYEITHTEEARKTFAEVVSPLFKEIGGIRITGSQVGALTLVASNRSDGLIATNSSPWDLAAANVILLEAGGQLANEKGSNWQLHDTTAIAGHPTRVRELVKILKPLYL